MVAKGPQPGPILGITAAVHGNEISGIPCIHAIFHDLSKKVKKLRGSIVAVPVVNVFGFQLSKRVRYTLVLFCWFTTPCLSVHPRCLCSFLTMWFAVCAVVIRLCCCGAGFDREYIDDKDLNRIMPGKKNGTISDQFAYYFFEKVVKKLNFLIDLHTVLIHAVPSLRCLLRC
jgi:predicted deacylase